MPGKTLDLQRRTLGQGTSSVGRVIHPQRVGFTNSATGMLPLPFPAKIFGFLLREPDWDARLETAFGPDNNIPRAGPITTAGLFAKRIMDLLLAAIALFLLWPLLLAIALAVKLESPGPVIYASLRAGKRDTRFVSLN